MTRHRATCDCGFDRAYASGAKAAYALRRHSCDLHQGRAEQRARGEARRAAVDRNPKPCHHKNTQHQHGTYACYTHDRCRCTPCTVAQSVYNSQRLRQQAYGRWDNLVDPEPARVHVRALMAQGMGLKRIIAISRVSSGQLFKLLYGKPGPDGTRHPSRRIRRETEAKILAVQLNLADGARVLSLGAVRRVQALVALGWSQSKIATRLGILPANFTTIAHGRRAELTVATDKAIRGLYEEWSMRLPPADEWHDKSAASRARAHARANGWLPPLAWDDDRLDDPTYQPTVLVELVDADEHQDELDEAAILRRINGDRVKLTRAEKAEVVGRLLAAGWPLNEIERHTGITAPYRYAERPEQAVS